ncbi:spore coat protein [Paenibacillus antarcticus]|uniref:Spore gernimation protein GerQ n=1 Tax=Paenibacillus antarcticus TaxID=253703 RepID=A0A168QKX1_9BACL|nr:spore coat protein [Paenibacillus antarcticus]OAB47901.1 spore gernimation protein GerQ [Paenibacillus antarcticus]
MQNQQLNNNQSQSSGLQNINRGGHELLDMHEALSSTIGLLDQFVIYRSLAKDNELLTILNRQYNFIQSHYNLTVECFISGNKPSHDTTMYAMPETAIQVTYGLTPSQPKKPVQSVSEIKDEQISGFMLGALKTNASLLTMIAAEVNNPAVRRVVAAQIENYTEMAYEVFLYQNKHKYYQVALLDNSDAQQMLHAYAPATAQPQIPIQ